MYGYMSDRFHSFRTLNGCRKALRSPKCFKSDAEFEIVRYSGKHISTGYQKGDVSIGFVFQDVSDPKVICYRPYPRKSYEMAYPIKADGSLDKKNGYEIF